ncbi:MAG: hypothetical protein HQ481_14290 [Alphaproteobacteria bacterium]|nr:hypothetical protein [Alphaproteobacteria bacterium]
MLDPSKLVDSDKLAAQHLATELDAGSTRVYNVNRLHQAASDRGATADQQLFRHPELHRVIFIKQALSQHDYLPNRGNRIGTKLYFSFNETNAYEGGKSIFVGDPSFDEALAFQAGFERSDNAEAYIHDRDIIQIIDQLPSLDPFLLKDRLVAESLEPHPEYFEISHDEWTAIREHVMKRFRPIVEFAFGGLDAAQAQARLRVLVQKLWEAKDMDTLGPVIDAMDLDREEAPATLHAWKGVIYYDHRMTVIEDRVKDLAGWLGSKAEPVDLIPPSHKRIIEEVRDGVRVALRERWRAINTRLGEYNDAYKALFIDKQSPGPFIAFLGNASDVFAELGDGLSRLDHAAEVRRAICARFSSDRLKYEPLHQTLSLIYRILT